MCFILSSSTNLGQEKSLAMIEVLFADRNYYPGRGTIQKLFQRPPGEQKNLPFPVFQYPYKALVQRVHRSFGMQAVWAY